jgi:hypothetical protein
MPLCLTARTQTPGRVFNFANATLRPACETPRTQPSRLRSYKMSTDDTSRQLSSCLHHIKTLGVTEGLRRGCDPLRPFERRTNRPNPQFLVSYLCAFPRFVSRFQKSRKYIEDKLIVVHLQADCRQPSVRSALPSCVRLFECKVIRLNLFPRCLIPLSLRWIASLISLKPRNPYWSCSSRHFDCCGGDIVSGGHLSSMLAEDTRR